jgi:hypothetical protein
MVTPERVMARAAERHEPQGDCWISTYSKGSHGYAQVGWWEGGKSHVTTAHRAAWEFHNGPIPDGLTVDHMCHTRQCVRVDHLRLLPMVENSRGNLSDLRAKWPLSDKRCRLGHYLTESQPKRYCRECSARRKRESKGRKAPN